MKLNYRTKITIDNHRLEVHLFDGEVDGVFLLQVNRRRELNWCSMKILDKIYELAYENYDIDKEETRI